MAYTTHMIIIMKIDDIGQAHTGRLVPLAYISFK